MNTKYFENRFFKCCWIIILVLTLLAAIYMLSGCACLRDYFCGSMPNPISPKPPNPFFELLYKGNWLMTLSVVVLGVGAFVLARGSFVGLQVIAAALTVLTAVITFTKYTVWFGIVGLVLMMSIFGYVVYINTKQKLHLNKAVQEIVIGVEKAKEIGESKIKETLKKVFNEVIPQSNSTKQIVENVVKKNGNERKD